MDPSGDGGDGLTARGLFCGSCGAQSSTTAKFCSECGTPVVQATRSAEYKQVTVLFADVVHSMDIAATELTKERTALKREASRAKGTRFGRPRKVDDADHIATAKRMKDDGHTAKDIAKYLGVSRATFTDT